MLRRNPLGRTAPQFAAGSGGCLRIVVSRRPFRSPGTTVAAGAGDRWTSGSRPRRPPTPSERRSTACWEQRCPSIRSCGSRTPIESDAILLLPALHALQDRVGWISRGGLDHVCRRLSVAPAEAYGVASFYDLFKLEPRPERTVHACVDIACAVAGGPVDGEPSPCLGLCEHAPAALVVEAGESPLSAPVHDGEWDAAWSVPQRGDERLVLLARAGVVDPGSLASYEAHDGYDALRKAMEIGASAVVDEVVRSGLVGRGGAGVPDGTEVAGGRGARVDAALPRRERRRERARHVQGPGADRERPLLTRRSNDGRGLRHRLREGLRLHARRVPDRAGDASPTRSTWREAWIPRRRHPRSRRSLRHRDAQGRRRLHLRRGDRPLQLDRGLPGRASQQAPVPGRRRALRATDRRQQRRDARQRAADRARRRRGVRSHRLWDVHRHEAVLRLGSRRASRRVRGAVRTDARRRHRARGRSRRLRSPPGGPARRRRGTLRRSRSARHATHVRRRTVDRRVARLRE